MSFSDINEAVSLMREIIALLDGAETKVGKVKEDVTGDGGGPSLRQEFRVMNMYMSAIQQWSGSDTLAQVGNKIQQTSAAVLRFYMLMEALSAVMAATSLNPFMIAYAGAHALGFAISVQNLMGQ